METHIDSHFYVPEISEFHVGFEYQVLDENGYHKVTLTDSMLSQNLQFRSRSVNFFQYIKEEIDKQKIKIKYLDKEDIESLGWKESPRGYRFDFKTKDDDFQLYFDDRIFSEELGVGITIYDWNSEVIFTGYVKNKSELKKLLQQLNIK